MTDRTHIRNTDACIRHFIFHDVFSLSANIPIRPVVREAAAVVAFALTLIVRVAIFPFQVIVFLADVVLAIFTLSIAGLAIALILGMISPGAAINDGASLLNTKMEQVITATGDWAARHPDTVLGRFFGFPAKTFRGANPEKYVVPPGNSSSSTTHLADTGAAQQKQTSTPPP